jgi:16S rRNA (adenine1518-N6/adenine1519-N6)-dimethyltransferase
MFDIPPGCFTPRPKVNSTALLLSPSKKIDMEFRQFRDFLHAAFSQKRKKLVNSLVSGETGMYKEFSRGDLEKILGYLGKQTDIRAEQLSLTDLVTLFKMTLE